MSKSSVVSSRPNVVLVAEDDAVSRTLMKEVIEGMGHVAFFSPNGEHAYEALELDQIDLGATYFLPKPLQVQELQTHIARCLADG